MMSNSANEARDLARAIGNMTGQPELADQILKGTLPANEVVPLAMGMIEGLMRQLMLPMVHGEVLNPPDPAARPSNMDMKMQDGTILRISIYQTRL